MSDLEALNEKLVRARCHAARLNYQAAMTSLEEALDVPGIDPWIVDSIAFYLQNFRTKLVREIKEEQRLAKPWYMRGPKPKRLEVT